MTEAPSLTARSYGTVFDKVAYEYDRNRWTYPDELIDYACKIAKLKDEDRVLEVGCGTGQLTRSLVARNLSVTALDPGKQLLSLSEKNLGNAKEIQFVNTRFEDAQLPREHFQAFFSASAFHWVDPDVSWQKAAEVLRPGGTFALIQYYGLQGQHDTHDDEDLLSALKRIAPEIAAQWPQSRDSASLIAGVEQRCENVSEVWAWIGNHSVARAYASRLFCNVQVAATPILIEQTADQLNALLRTTSIYVRLSSTQRQALEREHIAIYERLGRKIRSSTAAVLITAQRSAST